MWRMKKISSGLWTKIDLQDYNRSFRFIQENEVEEAEDIQEFMEKTMQALKRASKCLMNNNAQGLNRNRTSAETESEITELRSDGENNEDFDHLIGMVSKVIRMNNEVIDNELGGIDLTVKINRKGLLTIEEKELCAVRWSGAFLSSFGEFWSGQGRFSHMLDRQDELFRKCKMTLDSLETVSIPVNGNRMSISKMGWKAGGPYNSSLELWLKHHKRELKILWAVFL